MGESRRVLVDARSVLVVARSVLAESRRVLADALVRQFSVRRGRLTARLLLDRSNLYSLGGLLNLYFKALL